MSDNAKHTYVLIAGAWHGGWAWRDILPGLREAGHQVTTPTLTGLGERRHNGTAETDLTTHIEDVVAHIEMQDLQQVTLVGWSYGGMVISGVASRIPEKIKSMIYLDAFLPEDGKAVVDYISEESRAMLDTFKDTNQPLPPIPLPAFGVTETAIIDFVTPRLALQPWRTFYEPVRVLPRPAHIGVGYVYCSGYQPTRFTPFYEKAKNDPNVQTLVLDAHHLCMLSEPAKTVEALLALA